MIEFTGTSLMHLQAEVLRPHPSTDHITNLKLTYALLQCSLLLAVVVAVIGGSTQVQYEALSESDSDEAFSSSDPENHFSPQSTQSRHAK